MLLAGLVGVQAWYSRFQNPAQEPLAAATRSIGAADSVDQTRFSQWIRRANAGQGPATLMLDRRAKPRAEPGPSLPAGAIDKTAEKWLDSAYGLQLSVQNTHYGDKIAGHATIDWGSNLKPESTAGEASAAGSQKPD